MEPGAVDLNNLSPAEALDLLERVQEVVARQQTQDAIVRDVTEVVDPIVRDNREILGDQWVSGRVSWDGHRLAIECEEG